MLKPNSQIHTTAHYAAISLLTVTERKTLVGRTLTRRHFSGLSFWGLTHKGGVCDGGGYYYWEREKQILTWRANYYAPATIILDAEAIREALNEVITNSVQLTIFDHEPV